jgi:hypothetical protein
MALFYELRGLRNNNPGNIDYHDNIPWDGLDKTKPSDGRFCRFISPEYGIRAMARILRNYAKRDGSPGVGGPGIDTMQEIINRWAPPVENNTSSYVMAVCKAISKGPQEPLNLRDAPLLAGVIEAIIAHENGMQPYSRALVVAGIALAG